METQLNMIVDKKAVSIENKKWKLKLTLLLVSSLTIMSVITISPALPQMAAAFSDVKNSAFLVKLLLTIPALMIALFSPVTGRLIDRYGRLKILWFANSIYVVGRNHIFNPRRHSIRLWLEVYFPYLPVFTCSTSVYHSFP